MPTEGRDFGEVVEKIVERDSRYERGAYFFIRRGLDHTLKLLHKKDPQRGERHVSGHELLDGIRDFAINEYGPMTYTVLDNWGVRECEDFGEIVFNLVEWGVFGKTEQDSLEDFKGGYNFEDAFLKPYMPDSENDRGKLEGGAN